MTKKVNKITAPAGTIVAVAWPDVTAWIQCGWELYAQRFNVAFLKKAK